MTLHLKLHNLRKHDLCWWSSRAKTARPAVCLWGLYGVSVGSTAGWALSCRFTLRGFTVGQQLPAANFIMYPGWGLNNSTKLKPRVQDLLNQRIWCFQRTERVDLQYLRLLQRHLYLKVDVEFNFHGVEYLFLILTKVHPQVNFDVFVFVHFRLAHVFFRKGKMFPVAAKKAASLKALSCVFYPRLCVSLSI